jgi:hypothetical protein
MNKKHIRLFFNFCATVPSIMQQDSINLEMEQVKSIPKVPSEFNFGSHQPIVTLYFT